MSAPAAGKIRYLSDENVAPALSDQLRRLNPEIIVLKIGDFAAPDKGTPDPDILDWLEKEQFSLITRNRKSMPEHLKAHTDKGGHVPGIFTLKPRAVYREIIDDLLLIWEAADIDEFQDQIVFIPF